MPRSPQQPEKPDPREAPSYGIAEAAHYLGLPKTTLRFWTVGGWSGAGDRRRKLSPVIRIADAENGLLSFINLVEAHVLSAIRREHEVSLQNVRRALASLSRTQPSRHPLADHQFAVSGKTLFVRHLGALIDASHEGQVVMERVLDAYLERIGWDRLGRARRLYLFTRPGDLDQPRAVVVDPRISFGRPVLVGTGVPTAVVAQRYKGGESIEDLATDYGRGRVEIEEAIRCELQAA